MSSRMTHNRHLRAKIEAGEIVRVGNGIYVTPEELHGIEGDFYRATLLCGKKSAICLASALQYYGLSERMTGKTWILVPHQSTAPRRKTLRAFRSREPKWRVGVKKTPRFQITSIERTIVDAFRYHRLVGVSAAVYALKTALKEKQTTKAKIYEMAKSLGAHLIIRPYLEAA